MKTILASLIVTGLVSIILLGQQQSPIEAGSQAVLSPDGLSIIEYGAYDGYGPDEAPATTFVIRNAATREETKKIPYIRTFGDNTARFLLDVKWVDNRYVLVT